MKLSVAQLSPKVGPVEGNIDLHIALMSLAAKNGADLVVFPELSLTGYETSLAADLSRTVEDRVFEPIQSFCDEHRLAVGVGVPIKTGGLPLISTLVFQPNQNPETYSKEFLHSDELAFFCSGKNNDPLIYNKPKVALAICYELSVAQHALKAFAAGATAYVASVAKNESGVDQAILRLSGIAREHSALVLMSNCVGAMDGTHCCGRSAVWGRDGSLLAELDNHSNGIIVVDYETEETFTEILCA